MAVSDSRSIFPRALRSMLIVMTIVSVALGGYVSWPVLNDSPLVEAQVSESDSLADIIDQANPAVVTIYNLQEVDSRSRVQDAGTEQIVGAGSGWFYDEQGHIVTNAHVVAGASSVQVQLYDGTIIDAEVVGVDSVRDVAVLKIEEGTSVPATLPVGDSDQVRVGDQVLAIGSPLGEYANSVTTGIIGGLNRELIVDSGSGMDNLLQHDAEISSGNSGGPLLNMDGEFIGMNVAKIDSSVSSRTSVDGLNFAIEGNLVVQVVGQILESGSVAYPYLGVETADTEQGVVVMDVVASSPADEAGVQPGDVITAIADTPIQTSLDLRSQLFQFAPGDTISVTVERDDEQIDLEITLGTRPESAN